MAKAGFVLHGARGKVGNLVARKGDNKTILAEYQPIVRNPQTNAQMATRIILSTVSQAVPLLYPIIDHSFEGFAVGSKCTREFRRLNMNLLRQYAAIDFRDTPKAVDATVFMTTKGIKALIPNKYQISSGSLSAPRVTISRKNAPSADLKCLFSDFAVPCTHENGVYTFKIGDVIKSMFGITSPGEQLTFVVIQKAGDGYKYAFNGDDTMLGWAIPYTSMRAGRLVLKASLDFNDTINIDVDGTNIDDSGFTEGIIEAFNTPRTDPSLLAWLQNYLNEGTYEWEFEDDLDVAKLTWETSPGASIDSWCLDSATGLGHAYAAGVIRSKLLDNGNWAYSNAFMVLSRLTDDFNYGLDWNSAIQAWFEKNAVTDNSLFLKEGATANELGESFT